MNPISRVIRWLYTDGEDGADLGRLAGGLLACGVHGQLELAGGRVVGAVEERHLPVVSGLPELGCRRNACERPDAGLAVKEDLEARHCLQAKG